MIKKLKKSIFINIIATLGYVEFITFITTGFINNIFKILHTPQFIVTYFCELILGFLFFFPLYSILILVSNIITAILEIKQSYTNGFIINIPDKIINSFWYNTLFWIGIILTFIMCILRLIFSIMLLF